MQARARGSRLARDRAGERLAVDVDEVNLVEDRGELLEIKIVAAARAEHAQGPRGFRRRREHGLREARAVRGVERPVFFGAPAQNCDQKRQSPIVVIGT